MERYAQWGYFGQFHLDLSTHLHIVFMDGVWARREGKHHFFSIYSLSTQDVMDVLSGIERRLERLFRRRGLIRGRGPDLEEVRHVS